MSELLKWSLIINGIIFINIVFWKAIIVFNVPQRIIGFVYFNLCAVFSPKKLDELEFYTDGTWGYKIDDINFQENFRRMMEIEINYAQLLFANKADKKDDDILSSES